MSPIRRVLARTAGDVRVLRSCRKQRSVTVRDVVSADEIGLLRDRMWPRPCSACVATNVQAPVTLDFSKYFDGVTPLNPAFVQNPASYNLNGLSYNTRAVVQNTLIGAADWRYDSKLGRFPAFLKFSTKIQARDKDVDDTSDRYRNATARILASAPEVSYQGNVSQYDVHTLTGRTFSIGLRTTR